MWEIPKLEVLLSTVVEPSNPIGMRMRAAYYLRTIFSLQKDDEQEEQADLLEKQEKIIEALSTGLQDEKQGSLMRHEFAYVMGQLRDDRCCSSLEKALLRSGDCVMVRHEAAEALGAIGAQRSIRVLKEMLGDNKQVPPELFETCQIALDVMEWRERGGDATEMPAACACMLNPYSSVDPAPPHPSHVNMSVAQVGAILSNTLLPLFERYRAMFSLRNMGGNEAVQELCNVLVHDDSSALLRHEVAYVLGQMQHVDSIEALAESLRRPREHKMVRHESAEALGAIEGSWDVVEPILLEFSHDQDVVVRESCLVALDSADYWGHVVNQEHQEADTSSLASNEGPNFARQKADSNMLLKNHFNVTSSVAQG